MPRGCVMLLFHHQAADDGSSLVHVGLGQRSLLAPRFRVVVQLAVRLYGNILFFIKPTRNVGLGSTG